MVGGRGSEEARSTSERCPRGSKWQALIGITEYTFELEKESTGTLPFASPHISFELFLVSFKVCSVTDISVDAMNVLFQLSKVHFEVSDAGVLLTLFFRRCIPLHFGSCEIVESVRAV